MIKKINNYVSRKNTFKRVFFLFLATNVIYGIIIFVTIPKVMKYSDGMKILDMLPMGYNAEYVKNLFVTLGENGRHTYLFEQIPFDMIYPGLFGLTYSLIIFYLSKKINFDNLSIYKIALLPMFAGIFDYLENIGVIFLLTKFPDLNEKVVGTSSLFSLGKSLFTTLTFLTIITLLFLMVSKKIKMNKK